MKKGILAILILVLSLYCLSAKTVTITYDMNTAGSTPSSFPWDTSLKYPVYDMSSPPRIFLGYFDGENLYKPGTEIKIKKDITLTAMWQIPTAIVTFDYGYSNSPESITIEADYQTNINAPTVSRQGYVFDKWIDNTGKEYKENAIIWVDNDLKLTAVWKVNPIITLDYDLDNKTIATEIQYGSSFKLPSNIPEREGYTFYRWKNTSNSRTYKPDDTISNVKENITLVAEWKVQTFSIDFSLNYNGAISRYDSLQKDYGEIISLPEAPKRNNWVFRGWSDGTSIYEENEEVKVTKDILFKAQWERDLTFEEAEKKSLAEYTIPSARIPSVPTSLSLEESERVDGIIVYLLSIVEQNIQVEDYLEAYNILIGLMENPVSCGNEKVISEYNNFFSNYANSEEVKLVIRDNNYIPFENWDGLYGYKDPDGNILIEPTFSSVQEFHEGLAQVTTFPEKKPCFINTNGDIVITPQEEYLFADGNYMSRRDGIYSIAGYFSDGICFVLMPTGYTYIDRYGTINIEFLNATKENKAEIPSYLNAEGLQFCNGLIPARNTETDYWGYIDKTGKWQIPPRYKIASAFTDGYAIVMFDNGAASIISTDGKVSQPIEEEGARFEFNDGALLKIKVPYSIGFNGALMDVSLYDPATNEILAEATTHYFDTPPLHILNEGLFPIISTTIIENDTGDTMKEVFGDSITTFDIYGIYGNHIASYTVNGLLGEHTPFEKGKMTFTVYGDVYSMDYFGNVVKIKESEQ